MSTNYNNNSSKRLGRGIASLLEMDSDLESELNGSNENDLSTFENFKNDLQELDIDEIIPNPDQPRKYFDDVKLHELSESIKHSGLLQPIIVSHKNSDGKYVIIAGERRYRATKIAGIQKIRAIILNIEGQEILKNAILENVQREDLNPIEEAAGYRKIIDTFNYTHEQLAKEIGKSRAHITNLLRILTLPDEVQSAVKNGNISLGHAKVLLSVDNPTDYLLTVIEKQLSVRQLEKMIANGGVLDEEQPKQNNTNNVDKEEVANITFDMIKQLYSPLSKNNDEKLEVGELKNKIKDTSDEEWKQVEHNVKIIEKQLADSCGFDLHLSLKHDGSGKIEINFSDAEDLLEIVKLFK